MTSFHQVLSESEPQPLPAEAPGVLLTLENPDEVDKIVDMERGEDSQQENLEEEQQPQDQTMKVTFWYKGEETDVVFSRKPLGLRWKLKPPIKIDQVLPDSHAEEVGVKKG